jgi:adenylate kinase family enzyme
MDAIVRALEARPDGPRVVVVGTSGSGKTTFARTLAERLAVPHVELDALHWAPAWTERPDPEFRALVRDAVAAPAWVADGNYQVVRDLVWGRATVLVWLDYAFPLTFWRATIRTFRRALTREELFSGNVERLRPLDPEWIPWWVIRTWRGKRRRYPELLRRPEHAHLRVARLRRPREAETLLEALPQRRG